MRTKAVFPVLVFFALGLAIPVRADLLINFTLLTTALETDPAAPFSLDFQLNDGSATNDGNNTAMLSGFMFGTGGAAGPFGSAALNGGATGDLGSTAQITDSSFLNEFTQGFTPGDQLQFQLDLTTNVDAGGTPDEFTLAILDSVGAQIPTLSFLNVFVDIDIDSISPSILTYGSDQSQNTVAGGMPIDLDAPTFTSSVVTPVPEPATIFLAGLGLAILAGSRASRK